MRTARSSRRAEAVALQDEEPNGATAALRCRKQLPALYQRLCVVPSCMQAGVVVRGLRDFPTRPVLAPVRNGLAARGDPHTVCSLSCVGFKDRPEARTWR